MLFTRSLRAAPLAALLLAGAVLASRPVLAQDAGDDEIRDLADDVAMAEEAGYAWNDALRLTSYKEKATPFVVEAVGTAGATPLGKVVLSRVLLALGERARATETLLAVAGSDADTSIRVEAIRLLEEAADDTYEEELWGLLDDALDAKLRAALGKTLWRLTKDLEAKARLNDLLKADDIEVQVAGAIALAEVGDFGPKVRAVLQQIRDEPTERGRLADALLAKSEWVRITETAREGAAPAEVPDAVPADPYEAIVLDSLQRLRAFYVNPEKLDEQLLWEGAARGLVEAVGDPHTTFQSAKERESWTDNLTKEYGGIGAYVGYDEDGFFIITRPMFGSPAWNAKLRSGDRVITVDGWETSGEDLNEIVKHLRGPANEPVTIEVVRKGWTQPRKITMKRDQIRVPTVYMEMLPSGVGYIMVDNFAKNTAEEFREALRELERRGASSLVLDLRWNSGGYLRTAEALGDMLLPAERLVVETAGREGVHPDETYVSKGMSTPWSRTVPLRVLINGASASASEILSGSLQANGRAKVVGLRSYGKGSVQNVYPIFTKPFAEDWTDLNRNGAWDDAELFDDRNENGRRDPGEPYLDLDKNGRWNPAEPYADANGNGQYDCPAVKVTIAKYYVGKTAGAHEINPHRREMIIAGRREWIGGIEPDLPVASDDIDGWRAEAIGDLEEQGVFEAYLEKAFETDEKTMMRLALEDTRRPEDYPQFDEFYGSLETQLSKQDMWRWLHSRLRAKASDRLGRLLVGDWALDAQLQRAIHDLSNEVPSVRDAEVYAFLKDRTFEIPENHKPEVLAKARPVER